MKKSFIQNAALYGLILGFVSIIFNLTAAVLPNSVPMLVLMILVKLVTTVTIFWLLLKKQANESETFYFGNAVAFGTAMSLFSNIIFGAFVFLQLTVISPDMAEQISEMLMQVYDQAGMDEETFDIMLDLIPYIPYFALFGIIIMYTIVGLLYSVIIGNFVKRPSNPFETNN